MKKALKLYNGRGQGTYCSGGWTFYIAATSAAHAKRIIEAGTPTRINNTEVKEYYNEGSWGNSMSHIEPTEPCLYARKNSGEIIKLFPKN